MLSTAFGFFSILVFSILYYFDFNFFHKFDSSTFNYFAGGVGVAYIFINMVPQLANHQNYFTNTQGDHLLSGSTIAIYILALIGFIVFYLFDQLLVYTDRITNRNMIKNRSIYWANVLFVAIYNLMVGYTVGSHDLNDIRYQFIFLIAYFIHLFTLKGGIYNVSPSLYNRVSRYIIISALFLGYFSTFFFTLSDNDFIVAETLIIGAMILLVFKHKLPDQEDSKHAAFLIGLVIASILFILL